MLEWRQPMLLDDKPLAEIRIGISTLLVRESSTTSLRPALIAALVGACWPRSSSPCCSRRSCCGRSTSSAAASRASGRGELGVTLDLEGRRDQGAGRHLRQRHAISCRRVPAGARRVADHRAVAPGDGARPADRRRRARGQEPAQRDDHPPGAAEARSSRPARRRCRRRTRRHHRPARSAGSTLSCRAS